MPIVAKVAGAAAAVSLNLWAQSWGHDVGANSYGLCGSGEPDGIEDSELSAFGGDGGGAGGTCGVDDSGAGRGGLGAGAVSSSAVGTSEGEGMDSLVWRQGSGCGVDRGWVRDGAWGGRSGSSRLRGPPAPSPPTSGTVSFSMSGPPSSPRAAGKRYPHSSEKAPGPQAGKAWKTFDRLRWEWRGRPSYSSDVASVTCWR